MTTTKAKTLPVTSVGSGALFCWIDSNRTKGFATWDAEIAHMQSLGYELVPPNHHIPHWSKAEGARRLYVNGRNGPRELAAFFNRPARDLGYPLFFKQNVKDEPRGGL